jgi:transcriptional regulator
LLCAERPREPYFSKMNDAYPLRPFRIGDPGLLLKVMRQWPLATLISGEIGNASISLIPVLVKDDPAGDIHLFGHLDANNEHAHAIRAGAPISFQFTGPDAYASPDLYASPQLPGWLYVSIKGDGIIESIMDQDQLKSLLHESTTVFGGSAQEFQLDANDQRIDRFIGGIKGFTIKVTRISGIAKLAQDKGVEDANIATRFLLGTTDGGAKEFLELLLDSTLAE